MLMVDMKLLCCQRKPHIIFLVQAMFTPHNLARLTWGTTTTLVDSAPGRGFCSRVRANSRQNHTPYSNSFNLILSPSISTEYTLFLRWWITLLSACHGRPSNKELCYITLMNKCCSSNSIVWLRFILIPHVKRCSHVSLQFSRPSFRLTCSLIPSFIG